MRTRLPTVPHGSSFRVIILFCPKDPVLSATRHQKPLAQSHAGQCWLPHRRNPEVNKSSFLQGFCPAARARSLARFRRTKARIPWVLDLRQVPPAWIHQNRRMLGFPPPLRDPAEEADHILPQPVHEGIPASLDHTHGSQVALHAYRDGPTRNRTTTRPQRASRHAFGRHLEVAIFSHTHRSILRA